MDHLDLIRSLRFIILYNAAYIILQIFGILRDNQIDRWEQIIKNIQHITFAGLGRVAASAADNFVFWNIFIADYKRIDIEG